jgi:hypothetical protein
MAPSYTSVAMFAREKRTSVSAEDYRSRRAALVKRVLPSLIFGSEIIFGAVNFFTAPEKNPAITVTLGNYILVAVSHSKSSGSPFLSYRQTL